jgi:hypothetical protein
MTGSKGALPVAWHVDLHRPDLREHRLGADAVARVTAIAAGSIVLS